MSVVTTDHPRIRYAKAELTKLATALELADPGRLEIGMRVLELEEMLEESRLREARWRRSYEMLRDVMVAASGPDKDFERLDELTRVWAVTVE